MTASFGLWMGQVFSQENPAGVQETADVSCTSACYQQPHIHGQYGHSCPVHGRACPLRGKQVGAGLLQKNPADGTETADVACTPACYQQPQIHGHYGHACPVHGRVCPLRGKQVGAGLPQMRLPLPIKEHPIQAPQPAPNYLGGFLTPRQYPQGVPLYQPGVPPYQQGMPPYQPGVPPSGQVPNYPNYQGSVPEQRIVYVPYAMPPPIQVERLGKALPRPPVPIMRRILGDAYMYEYPEMPARLYTTRGPRDFFAPNPPSIGE
jgi:hypothetical protein